MQAPAKNKLSEKELLKVSLFRSVKQINGERTFRQLCEASWALTFEARYSDKQMMLKQNFLYVREGEILVYKILHSHSTKSLIRSYRAQEYCGFQDYPLFWGEDFVLEVNPNTTLIVVPLTCFYKFFRRVIPMMQLNSKAELLKRQPLFKGIEVQKIFRLACLSQKYRICKESIVMTFGQKIDYIFIVCNGKLQIRSDFKKEPIIIGQNDDIFVREVTDNIQECEFSVKCAQEADVLAIPRQEFLKISDLRYSLRETIQKDTEVVREREREPTIFDDNRSQKSYASSVYTPKRMRSFAKSWYPRQTTDTPNNFGGGKSASKRTTTYESLKQESDSHSAFGTSGYSLGEIQLLKFIRRKQKIENRSFFKYIESRAPEIVINPSKEFAIFKPLYKNGSLYVKNMKRKIKHSMSVNHSTTFDSDLTGMMI